MEIINKNAAFDIAGIGSALLDLTLLIDDESLKGLGLKKGEMQLIDGERSREILRLLEGKKMDVTPGGSSANTIAGVSNLGGRGVFFGKVGMDRHGDIYIEDTERSGVRSQISRGETMTGHAITFITPDSERTFATHLGAALSLDRDDISEEEIKNSKILHIEGYLFEPPGLREASLRAIDLAKKHNLLVSVDLSDPGLIGRIHDIFRDIVRDHVDIVFVNEDEARAFTGKAEEEAINELSRLCAFAVVKLGSSGSLIKTGGELYRIPVYKTEVVNTNGAGDMYAAGVLYGISRGFSPEKTGRIGSYASSLVVAQVGARITGKISVDF